MDVDLKAGIVRILKSDGSTAGTGFVVSDDGLIATCAHVVQLAEAGPGDTVQIAFQASGQQAAASVESKGWHSPDAEDTAFLQMTGSLPPGVMPVVLGASAGREGADILTFGYPDLREVDGVWGEGKLLGSVTEAGRAFLQLRSGEITVGFSGAPVWEASAGRVIGMVATVTVPDTYQRLSQTAFAIPVETLHGLVPGLILQSIVPALLSPHFRTHFPYNEHFVGREAEFERLHHTLMEERSGSRRPVGLTGMGGIGKTQLAAEYARRYQDAYPGGIFGVDATSEKGWAKQLEEQADWLGLTPADPHSPDRTGQMIAAMSRRMGEQPDSLILFDNVSDPHRLKTLSLGAGITVAELGGLLLFTTRQRELPKNMVALDVPPLPPSSARQMIVAARLQAADDPALDELCLMLDNLPLALALATAALRHRPRMTLSFYLEKLREMGADTVHQKAGVTSDDLAKYYETSLTPALNAQWKMLESKDAQILLRAAAELSETKLIPIAWLELLTGLQDDERGLEEPLSDAVKELWAVSLIDRIGDDRLRLHSLVRDFAQKMAPEDRPALQHQLEANAVAALQDPAQRWQRAITAGECLLDLQRIDTWSPATMRHATLEALRELMRAEKALPEDKRTAAFLLTRLRWLDDAEDVPFDELSDCLEWVGPYLDSPGDRQYLVAAIASLLKSKTDRFDSRQRAHLFVYRAINHGYLHELEAAARDYRRASRLIEEILDSGESQMGDKRFLARINLGLGNIARLQAEKLIEPQGEERRRRRLHKSRASYRAAYQFAQAYGQDVILEANILKELSLAYALLGIWAEAQAVYQQALITLTENQERIDPEALVRWHTEALERACHIEWLRGESLGSQGLQAYRTGLKFAEEGIAVLEKVPDGSEGLVIAYLNAGDCLLGMSRCADEDEAEFRTRACEAWRRAFEIADSLGLSDLADEAKEILEQHCPSKAFL